MPVNLKRQSHGKIGEAAVYAKCWIHGILAYFTGSLKTNFAGSDLVIMDATDPQRKLWIEVKTGFPTRKNHVYLTQSAGETDLACPKFMADFVVFVNLDAKAARTHTHDGTMDFQHLSYYVVPRDDANSLFRAALQGKADRPKRDGTKRKLGNVAVEVPCVTTGQYRDAWAILKLLGGSSRLATLSS